MNAPLRFAAAVAVSSVTLGAIAREPQVEVAASRDLKLAIIDTSKATPARAEMHEAFARSLGAFVSNKVGSPVGVKAKCVSADHAAFNFRAGVYDAVLVVGRNVPSGLRKGDVVVLSAAPEVANRERAFSLLISDGDATLRELLASGFAGALSDEKFLRALASTDGKPLPTGDKVAVR